MYARGLSVALLGLAVAGLGSFAHAAPNNKPYASDAHRGAGGAYGGLKSRNPSSNVPAMRDRAGLMGWLGIPLPRASERSQSLADAIPAR